MNLAGVEALLTKLIGISIFAFFVIAALYSYYLIITLSIAIWFPNYSRKSWSRMLDSPIGHIGYHFFKWAGPVLAFAISVNLISLFVSGVVRFLG